MVQPITDQSHSYHINTFFYKGDYMSLAKFRKIFKGNDEVDYPIKPKDPEPTSQDDEQPKDEDK